MGAGSVYEQEKVECVFCAHRSCLDALCVLCVCVCGQAGCPVVAGAAGGALCGGMCDEAKWISIMRVVDQLLLTCTEAVAMKKIFSFHKCC